jgi:hypothetical protein
MLRRIERWRGKPAIVLNAVNETKHIEKYEAQTETLGGTR